MFDQKVYNTAYMRARRAADKAAGICVTCSRRKARAGVATNGARFSQCRRCIDKAKPRISAALRRRVRVGLCRSCPRRRPRGDRHTECPPCRARKHQRDTARLRTAA